MKTPQINWSSEQRLEKHIARKVIFSSISWQKSGIFLPGPQCECIKAALRLGAISTATRVIAVERIRDYALVIRNELDSLKFTDFTIHSGQLCTLKLDEPIHFAFLDFLGALTFNDVTWLADILSPNLVEGATLFVTLANNSRGNRFMPDCDDVFRLRYRSETTRLASELGCANFRAVNVFALFKTIFSQWDFDAAFELKYNDSQRMFIYKMNNFRLKAITNTWPTVSMLMRELLEYNINRTKLTINDKAWVNQRAALAFMPAPKPKFIAQLTPQQRVKNPKMVLAAHKAWATRRAKLV